MNPPDAVPPPDEEAARARMYGLLATLWLQPPDEPLLQRLRDAAAAPAQPGALLDAPWRALLGALAATGAAQAADEFVALFQGVGKPDLLPYASYHLSGYLNDRPLARLRDDLAALGLQRGGAGVETEDHLACIFDVMRHLIERDPDGTLGAQQRLFRAHLQPWVEAFCDAVDAHPRARLWRTVAALTRAFVQVETQAFDLLEA